MEEERTNPCRCQPWALDIGHYAALKTLKDLSAKTLVLFISQILPWPFWGLQPVLENLVFFFASSSVLSSPTLPSSWRGEGLQLAVAAPSLPLICVSTELGWKEA